MELAHRPHAQRHVALPQNRGRRRDHLGALAWISGLGAIGRRRVDSQRERVRHVRAAFPVARVVDGEPIVVRALGLGRRHR